MQALRDHYDGPAQVEKRIAEAHAILERVYYKSEQTFSFEQYTTKLNEAFDILEENGVPQHERDKVNVLLKNIQSDNQVIIVSISNVKMNAALCTTFEEAANRLSELISSTFTAANMSNTGKRAARNVSLVGTNNKQPRRKKNQKGKIAPEGRGVADLNDPTKSYSPAEWWSFSQEASAITTNATVVTLMYLQSTRKQRKVKRPRQRIVLRSRCL